MAFHNWFGLVGWASVCTSPADRYYSVPRLYRPSTPIHLLGWPCKAQHLFISTQQTLEVVKWPVFSSSLGGRFQFGRPTLILLSSSPVAAHGTPTEDLETGWHLDLDSQQIHSSFKQAGLRDSAQPTDSSFYSVDWPFLTWHSHNNSSILLLLRRFQHTQGLPLHARPVMGSCSKQVSSTEDLIQPF